MKSTVRVWNDKLLVDYTDKDGNKASFVIETVKDIEDLKKELE